MKKVFLLKYLLLYSTLANNHQGPPTAKKISPPSPNTPDLPILTWTSPTSLHVTYPDHEEDIINLHPSDTGGFPVNCLYDGTFSKEATASAVVSGCFGNSSTYITVYTSHLQGTVFTVRNNVTTEERNPYANEGVHYFEENPLGDREAARVRRSEFYYYSGEDEYVDLDFDGPLEPTPPNLLLLYKLAFDETLKAHFGGDEDAARAYTIEVATHASVHMKHSSLGVKIHMLRVEHPKFAQGLTLTFSSKLDARKSLTKVQNIKEMEPVPLIAFCKSDDLSSTLMGSSWPGRRGGACNATKGSAIVKWRSNIALAGVTLAHESGHLTGQLEDYVEDKINKRKDLFDPQNPCEGLGIMSSGSRSDRPKKWSSCSQERLMKWFPIHGQCLVAPNCTDDLDWTTPCFCGPSMCLSQHIYCMRKSSNEAEHQCLSRVDLGHQLQNLQPFESVEIDVDYSGNNIDFIDNIPDWQSCERLCFREATCSHWTWFPPDHYGEGERCYRKNSGSGRSFLSFVISGSVATRKSDYKVYNNGPGCGAASIRSSTECGIAAASLGYNRNVGVENWSTAPPGCMVGYSSDGWKRTWFNNHGTGQTGRNIYGSVCHKGDYVPYKVYNNGPGCGAGSIKNSSECGIVAASLGYNGKVTVGDWSTAPPGCMVGQPSDDWKSTFFNTNTTGQKGSNIYRSVCHDWIDYIGVNCVDKIGADNVDTIYGLTVDECKKACEDNDECQGIIRQTPHKSYCWLARNFNMEKCYQNGYYDTYLLGSHKGEGEWTAAVWLNADSTQIVKNVGEQAFNAFFAKCPVVQYSRNGAMHSVYIRTSTIPPSFNAFSVFTHNWISANNELNIDFRLYDHLEDAKNDRGAWNFCNYVDLKTCGVCPGYPRDCGKSGRGNHRWFRMPNRGKSSGITSGIGFDIYTGSMCPSTLGEGV